jgi:hypothetical protein
MGKLPHVSSCDYAIIQILHVSFSFVHTENECSKDKKTNKLFHGHSAPERAEIPKQHILGSPRMPL